MSISSTAFCERSGLMAGTTGIVEIGERLFERWIDVVALLNEFF